MTKKEYKKWVKKLVKYWKMREKVLSKFKKEEYAIEKLMKKETGMNLEFFYTIDGECCGVGHENWARHHKDKPDYFPLIHDMDLSDEMWKGKRKEGESTVRPIKKGDLK